MIPHVRGMFWVAIQILLLVAWFMLVVLDRQLVTGDAVRFAMDGMGALLIAVGLPLAIWGVHDLGPNLTPLPEPKHRNSFITSGVYGKVRHPIYGGVIMMIIGTTLLFPTTLGFLILPAVLIFFYSKSRYEEGELMKLHADYGHYATATRRFIPFVW